MRTVALKPENLVSLIHFLRGEKVLLSEPLASLYGVTVSALNQAVKRNIERFPDDFMFQLTREEVSGLPASRSQTVILKRGQNINYLPYAFTEQGIAMLSSGQTIMQASRRKDPQLITKRGEFSYGRIFEVTIETSGTTSSRNCEPRDWGV
ncbi:MAG: ORF6N domain-containing protein [Burkholderiales bacterium]